VGDILQDFDIFEFASEMGDLEEGFLHYKDLNIKNIYVKAEGLPIDRYTFGDTSHYVAADQSLPETPLVGFPNSIINHFYPIDRGEVVARETIEPDFNPGIEANIKLLYPTYTKVQNIEEAFNIFKEQHIHEEVIINNVSKEQKVISHDETTVYNKNTQNKQIISNEVEEEYQIDNVYKNTNVINNNTSETEYIQNKQVIHSIIAEEVRQQDYEDKIFIENLSERIIPSRVVINKYNKENKRVINEIIESNVFMEEIEETTSLIKRAQKILKNIDATPVKKDMPSQVENNIPSVQLNHYIPVQQDNTNPLIEYHLTESESDQIEDEIRLQKRFKKIERELDEKLAANNKEIEKKVEQGIDRKLDEFFSR
jgi:hypothetical protein